MKRDPGFQRKLFLGFSAISFVSMTVCGLFSYFFTSHLVKKLSLSNLSAQIKGVESAISVTTADNLARQNRLADYWAPQTIKQLNVRADLTKNLEIEHQADHRRLWTQAPTVYVNGHPLEGHDLVDRISLQTGNATTVFVRVPEGFLRVSTSVQRKDGSRAVGTFIPNDSPVSEKLLQAKRFTGRASIFGSWYVTAYEPIVQKGEVVGAFFLGVPETSYDHIKKYLSGRKILGNGYFYILDSSGNFVLHPTLENENLKGIKDRATGEILEGIISKKDGVIEYPWEDTRTGQAFNKIAVFHYFPEVDWYVAASLNVEETQAPVLHLRLVMFFIAVGMTIAMAVVTLFFGRSVATQLGEVSQLLNYSSQQVESRSMELATTSELLAQASAEQAASLQETASAVEEIRSTVSMNLETTVRTEESSTRTAKGAQAGREILLRLAKNVSEIARDQDLVKAEMKQSHDKIESIIEVISTIKQKTEVINEIVFQTKLLSFNASVEAARAGEHGKGFSVVAEEVGRLANLSGSAAAEIHRSLETSSEEVRTIVTQTQSEMERLISQAAAKIEEGVKISLECQKTFEDVLFHVAQTHQAVQGISEASREQTRGVEEISRAMQRMDLVTQQNSNTAYKVNDLSSKLGSNAGEMRLAVNELKLFLNGQDEGKKEEDKSKVGKNAPSIKKAA